MKFENVDKLNSNEVQQMYFDVLDTGDYEPMGDCKCFDLIHFRCGKLTFQECRNWCRNFEGLTCNNSNSYGCAGCMGAKCCPGD